MNKYLCAFLLLSSTLSFCQTPVFTIYEKENAKGKAFIVDQDEDYFYALTAAHVLNKASDTRLRLSFQEVDIEGERILRRVPNRRNHQFGDFTLFKVKKEPALTKNVFLRLIAFLFSPSDIRYHYLLPHIRKGIIPVFNPEFKISNPENEDCYYYSAKDNKEILILNGLSDDKIIPKKYGENSVDEKTFSDGISGSPLFYRCGVIGLITTTNSAVPISYIRTEISDTIATINAKAKQKNQFNLTKFLNDNCTPDPLEIKTELTELKVNLNEAFLLQFRERNEQYFNSSFDLLDTTLLFQFNPSQSFLKAKNSIKNNGKLFQIEEKDNGLIIKDLKKDSINVIKLINGSTTSFLISKRISSQLNDSLKTENAILKTENATLKTENAKIESLKRIIQIIEAENRNLKAKNREVNNTPNLALKTPNDSKLSTLVLNQSFEKGIYQNKIFENRLLKMLDSLTLKKDNKIKIEIIGMADGFIPNYLYYEDDIPTFLDIASLDSSLYNNSSINKTLIKGKEINNYQLASLRALVVKEAIIKKYPQIFIKCYANTTTIKSSETGRPEEMYRYVKVKIYY